MYPNRLRTFAVLYFVILPFSPASYEVTVIRRKGEQDLFTKPNPSSKCDDFGAGFENATVCRCPRTPLKTFIAWQKTCVNYTDFLERVGLLKFFHLSGYKLIDCQEKEDFTTLTPNVDTVSADLDCNYGNSPRCKVTAAQFLDEETGQWTVSRSSTDFNISRQGNLLTLKWVTPGQGAVPKGRVVKINITCSKNSDYQTGQILVKTTGSSTWTIPPRNPSTGTSSSTITTSTVSSGAHMSASRNEPVTPSSGNYSGGGGGNLLITVIPAVLGSIIFVILIVILVWFVIRKRRKGSTETTNVGENPENPTYGRGPDVVMTTGHTNETKGDDSTNYQPIVQNTRESGTTYQALEGTKRGQPVAQTSSPVYQSLAPNSASKPAEQEGNYQPLAKNRDSYRRPDPGHQQGTEQEYAVLEDPEESTNEAEAPDYQVLEQDHVEGPSQENAGEPVYNVLEAE